jgi:hypothetical protein
LPETTALFLLLPALVLVLLALVGREVASRAGAIPGATDATAPERN